MMLRQRLTQWIWLMLAGLTPPTWAQDYPVRAIHLIVPAAAGGAGDIVARTVAGKLSEMWRQPIVVENRPGANTIIGTDFVAKSKPDGYTWLLGVQGALGINPALYARLPYDPMRDFDAVTLLTLYGYLLTVHPSVPVKSTSELIAYVKSRPGGIAYSTSGTGGSNHLAGELFRLMTSIELTPVPYKGTSLALNGLLAAEVPMMFDTLITSIPHIKAGRIRPLAVTLSRRSRSLPEVPTLDESGVPGYEFGAWQAILMPAGTSKQIIGKIHADVVRVLAQPDVRHQLGDLGANELIGSTPEQLARQIQEDIEKYRALVKNAGVKVE